MRRSERIQLWHGEALQLFPGVSLIRLGGHFRRGTVLHWQCGTAGKGILLSGDIVQVVADRNWVSFMYSYLNDIPLSVQKVAHIQDKLRQVPFDRIYGAWIDAIVPTDGNRVVERSAERYIPHSKVTCKIHPRYRQVNWQPSKQFSIRVADPVFLWTKIGSRALPMPATRVCTLHLPPLQGLVPGYRGSPLKVSVCGGSRHSRV